MSENLLGKIQTVQGCINPGDAGKTLVHEHLSINTSALVPTDPSCHRFEELRAKPLTPDIGWFVNHFPYSSHDNVRHFEEHDAITNELLFFKEHGGGTIVENTTFGIERDIKFLANLSKATDVHIVAGTGYYVESSRPSTVNLKVEEMAAHIKQEIIEGCDGTKYKAGVVGELGCSWPMTASEKRVLQAAAITEAEIGCPVTVHPGRHHDAPEEILRIYEEAGGHASRFVMSHMDRTITDIPDLLQFATKGCYIDYDLFGLETSYYQLSPHLDMLSDAQRIQRIKALIDAGFVNQVTMAHDIHTKHRLMKYGGHGYSHILINVVPKMLQRGITEEHVRIMLQDNAQKWLAFTKDS